MSSSKLTGSALTAEYLSYQETGSFSRLVTDYLDADSSLRRFYKYEVNLAGIRSAIQDRSAYRYDREGLVSALRAQYAGITLHDAVEKNIRLLLEASTFTITTAHQPNIFTGPLYFLYKIIHAIKIADSLKSEFPSNDFVPVFFMGSEDADLDELGTIITEGKKYTWRTKQQGAVGRMKVDKEFVSLIDELSAQLQVLPHGAAVIEMFQKAYRAGETIQQATLELVNQLFGEFGLVILIPDNDELKKAFQPVVEKELKEQFSHSAVGISIDELRDRYKVQAEGRELNLFYLLDDKRERIERKGDLFRVKALGKEFTEVEILRELDQHPERFSPNVILRGVFQEMILPNIVFIGGGGEIAYWLELKKVFEAVQVPYPVLVLRNSFLVMTSAQREILAGLGFKLADVFLPADQLLKAVTRRFSANQLSLSEEIGELNSFYQQLHETAAKIDPSLAEHVNALQAKALKPILALEKKMLRAEKRKFEVENRRIHQLRQRCFPGDQLQERVENFSGFYARYGPDLLRQLYTHSPSLQQQFTVLTF